MLDACPPVAAIKDAMSGIDPLRIEWRFALDFRHEDRLQIPNRLFRNVEPTSKAVRTFHLQADFHGAGSSLARGKALNRLA
ncbi:MAG: hypothetical protein HZY79_08295 [Rhodoblastus sp.]|nr:MAG: hypothetical protein HZY79_08295 [Rhodoblastus sp.]